MPQPVTVYRWNDPGAPQIVEYRPSEIIQILKKCLVDGYGSKLGLGWSIPFEDLAANKIIFKNSIEKGGSGGVLRVEVGDAGNGVREDCFMTPAVSAIDVNTLFRAGYRHPFHLTYTAWNKWALIGTATAFYFVVGGISAVAPKRDNFDCTGFFGDFQSLIPSDSGRFIAITNANQSGDSPLTFTNPTADNNFGMIWNTAGYWDHIAPLKIYSSDGRDEFREYCVKNFWGLGKTDRAPATRKQGLYTAVQVALSQKYHSGEYSPQTDSAGVKYTDSIIFPLWRGYLPGLIMECFGRYSTQNWPVTEMHLGKNHWLMRSSTGIAGCWINMEEWP